MYWDKGLEMGKRGGIQIPLGPGGCTVAYWALSKAQLMIQVFGLASEKTLLGRCNTVLLTSKLPEHVMFQTSQQPLDPSWEHVCTHTDICPRPTFLIEKVQISQFLCSHFYSSESRTTFRLCNVCRLWLCHWAGRCNECNVELSAAGNFHQCHGIHFGMLWDTPWASWTRLQISNLSFARNLPLE